MGKIKRGVSVLLVLVMCFSITLPYVRQVLASDIAPVKEAASAEYKVTLEKTDHGRVRFADSEEEVMTYHEGDMVVLEINPLEGYELSQVIVTTAKAEEDGQNAERSEELFTESAKEQMEENRLSFIMKDCDVTVHSKFREIVPDIESEAQSDTLNEPSIEMQLQDWPFPYKGYVWGKDSKKTDTGLTARLMSGRMARSAIGSDAVIRPGTAHSYGSWGTNEFSVTTGAGQFLGYCAQPNLATPDGTYRISELDNDMIKAALLIAPGGVPQLYEDYGRNIYNEADNNVYAYAHALIGYLYMGSLKGLSSSMAQGVENMASVLTQVSHNPLDPSYGVFQSYFNQYKVYAACSDSAQDIVWLEKNPTGYARLKKASANTEITDGNSCYSLAGAQYGVFRDNGCTQLLATLITDESGNSNTASLDAGTYYVKETTAARGYMLDPNVYPIQVTAGDTAELRVSDEPVLAPQITLYKVDRETKSASALGAASLENTQFRVNFYNGYFTKENLPSEPTRSWILKTRPVEEKNGIVRYAVEGEEQYKTDGDALYRTGEDIVLPLGTISVEEVQAPPGYQLDSTYLNLPGGIEAAEKIHVAKVVQNGDQGIVEDGTEYAVADSVIRGDFELTKIDKNTQQPIANVPFRITSNTTNESHIIMTDENGHYSSASAYAAHSYQTNGGKAGDGLWFGLDEKGDSVAVDDNVGALPYDTYTIEELKCGANEGKFLYSGTFTITRANYIVNLGNIENADVAIQTTAKDEATGTHYAAAGEVTIIDTVSYIGLQKNKTYKLSGTLMNRTTGSAVTDKDGNPVTATKEFTPKDSNGEVEVEFFFDASGLEGTDVVVYEELYLGGEKLADHADLNDSDQTIHFPAIGTKAVDDKTGCEMAKADEEITIVDTVAYENLRVGRKYKITGILMDKETGRAVLDDNGSKIEAKTEFTAQTASGTAEVIFRFQGRNLAGKTVVAFETLEKDNKEYAVHHDISDEAQTIYIPKIETSACDSDTESQLSRADADVTVMDEVIYENLVPGRGYVIKGTMVDPETKKAAKDADGNPITAQTTFTPQQKDGSVKLTFRFDGRTLAGETLVIYEELFYQENSVAEHKDANDAKQTIYFPSVATTAEDQKTGEQISFAEEKVTIEDVVHYENLIPGKKYLVSGTLMDQSNGEPMTDANGEPITAGKEFTAKEADGDVTVIFEFDGSLLAGKVTVAFEELFLEKKSIAVHADIKDEPQTVRFPEIKTQALDKETGINLTMAADEITVVDTVSYRHLIPDKEYHLEGTLMDQETGGPALDAKGKEIHADTSFVPEKADGTIELAFQFPGEGLENHTFVVFEELTMKISWFKKVKTAVHQDIGDEAQTIYIPEISTTAIDDNTKTQQSAADGEISLTDTVSYSNLLPGYEYTLTGILMDQKTGEPLKDDEGKKITAEYTFIAEEPNGKIEMPFSFSGTSFTGKTAVVFEGLAYEGKPVAKHEDIDDSKQSIYFPMIKTSASDKADGDQELEIGDAVTITDQIEYQNLIAGQEYRIAGTIMDKASGEALITGDGPVIAEHVFTAEKASGSVDVDFTFRSDGMEECELVVFEKLYMNENGIEAAAHEDLEDQGQTVKLVKKPVPAGSVNTGDSSEGKVSICLILLAASGAVLALGMGKRGQQRQKLK